uniref:Nematode resistance n=1 Tax=Solanum tuberosum TaxID=4113 RepID=M1E0Q2_SOLTU
MGENVIREEYANSRIWLPEEVCDLFKGKLITEKVESLCIPKDYYFEDDLVDYSNIFKRMQSLKIPIVGGGSFNSNCAVTYLPSSLRFIDWIGYPSISLPESFEPSQLVVLCLPESRLVELWPISKCDFHQRDYFLITFPRVRISELFDYDCPFINQEKMSIDLNPSWYTNKFMGFWITYGPTTKYIRLEATLVCKSDPERKYSLKYGVSGSFSNDPFIYCWYIPFETLWNASGNKEGKNPNDYYMLEFSHMYGLEKEVCWGIRLVYEEEAMSDDSGHRKKKRSNE